MDIDLNPIPCEIYNHNKPISYVCLQENCKSKKLCCEKCIKHYHKDC